MKQYCLCDNHEHDYGIIAKSGESWLTWEWTGGRGDLSVIITNTNVVDRGWKGSPYTHAVAVSAEGTIMFEQCLKYYHSFGFSPFRPIPSPYTPSTNARPARPSVRKRQHKATDPPLSQLRRKGKGVREALVFSSDLWSTRIDPPVEWIVEKRYKTEWLRLKIY